MNRLSKSILSTVAVVGLFAGLAQADSVPMNVYNTTKAGATDVTAAAVNVNVVETATRFKFMFTNNSSIVSSLTKVYFDNSLASVLTGAPKIGSTAGVDYSLGVLTKLPPKSASIGWTSTLAFFRAVGTNDPTKIANGVAQGGIEGLTIAFAKAGGVVLQDVLDLLTSTGGIAAHLVNLEGNGITTNVDLTTLVVQDVSGEGDDGPNAVPTPAAAFGGLALLAGLASARRRRDS